MEAKCIRVVGARQHNLQNITVDVPREQLVVVTGLSGSGKSSLAFDTIYAEGQRKYVESLSVHARHFLEQVGKPDVDRIEGLPPTLAIEQRASAANPRSTVATTTEVYDFLRLMFSRVGTPHCPGCGTPLVRRTADQVVDEVMRGPDRQRVMILAPLARGRVGDPRPIVRRMQRDGFVRARVNSVLRDVVDLAELPKDQPLDIDVVIDRLTLRADIRPRLSDAVELSFTLAEGTVVVAVEQPSDAAGGADGGWRDHVYSNQHACTQCGVMVSDLSPRAFSFNSPYGACEACDGLGTTLRFDESLIVPDDSLSLVGGAIAPWTTGKQKVGAAYLKLIKTLLGAVGVSPSTPFGRLSADVRRIVMHGTNPNDVEEMGVEFEGVLPNLDRRLRAAGNGSSRTRFAAYQTEDVCTSCNGARLRPEPLGVRIDDRSIHDITRLSIGVARQVFDEMQFDGERGQIADPILREIRQRLRFMDDVGLGYLTLERVSATLSGGEAQRIRLATQLGSGLVGVCYVLDEPTIGLHQRDNERLLLAIRRLVDAGNTAVVVEHDEDVIRAADHLIDIGPGAGLHGGRVIAVGAPDDVFRNPDSITGRFIRGEYSIPLPESRRTPRKSEMLQVLGAAENNLQGLDVKLPLGVFCAVTGVSGSGKSTLISQILLPALRRRLNRSTERIGAHERLVGVNRIDKVIEIDQTPIGRSPRSNPATYTGVFDEIRELYAKTREAKIRGYNASRFSFNVKGGRCEACQGQGTKRIEMHFLPDLYVVCQECKGTRYSRETLEVRYRGKSIADVLDMRVEEAIPFFESFPKIKHGLQALSDVGLGYIRIGQPSNTLSGGEAQRVKLAGELARGALHPLPTNGPPIASATERAKYDSHTLYVLDEPTTGLHFADIQTLLAVLNRLVDMGNTVLVVEHNLDVIKTVDWIIDLGPEGGEDGGRIVAEGTPEEVAACQASQTGRFLAPRLKSVESVA